MARRGTQIDRTGPRATGRPGRPVGISTIPRPVPRAANTNRAPLRAKLRTAAAILAVLGGAALLTWLFS
ncbi:hypothetical protein [Inquilinus sp. Marseille-Q2685]|uniref:hypothetical protein n=1 Tax=Inquilinus sp. Marseille-Q2685 TaxID=2866581 RepID=UPI001CE3D752|nr:hypothetical protein [Inquilinus sp. Marseille-Q2685]